jgi:NodT family efflux transporter outer membrane factor (OMF) lipoprotein
MVGPDFARPEAPGGRAFREAKQDDAVAASTGPEEAEKRQRIALGKKLSVEWWDLFRSPELDTVIRQALDGNRSLAAARATLAQAQESAVQAGAARLPTATFGATAQRTKGSGAASGLDASIPARNLFSIGPTVSYNLDVFGGLARESERQQALADSQRYFLGGAYLALTGNLVTQAVQIASLRAQIAALEEMVAQDERNYDNVAKLFELKEATKIDVEAATSQVATDRTQLPPLRQQLSVARHAVAVLVGQIPADWTPPDFDLDDFTLPEELPLSIPSELVRQRPDVLAAEAQLHAASAAVGVAAAQQYPNLVLSAGMSQQALSPSTLFAGPATIWNLANNLTAPLFNWGALDAQRRAAEHAADASRFTYQQTVLASFAQVADLLDALEHDTELLEAQRRALVSTQTSAKLTRTAFATGEARLIQVLDAERLYQQARLGYIRAKAQRYIDTAQLLVATGGSWSSWHERGTAAAEENRE